MDCQKGKLKSHSRQTRGTGKEGKESLSALQCIQLEPNQGCHCPYKQEVVGQLSSAQKQAHLVLLLQLAHDTVNRQHGLSKANNSHRQGKKGGRNWSPPGFAVAAVT